MLHTHYDNLKVARRAPQEVIRAAYKALSQKYHPDKNPGDVKAAHVMAMLNSAYGILADPQRRREHDEWIAAEEWEAESQAARQEALRHSQRSNDVQPTSMARRGRGWLLLSTCLGVCIGVGIGLYIGLGWPDALGQPAAQAGAIERAISGGKGAGGLINGRATDRSDGSVHHVDDCGAGCARSAALR
jgi:hypothetical protein